MHHLTERALVAVTGPDAVAFLDGLLTTSVAGLGMGEARFAGLLTPQGKVLFDGLVVRDSEGFLIDCPAPAAADFAKRLGFYKLRAKVTVAPVSDGRVVAAIPDADAASGGLAYDDPRHPGLGGRVIVTAGAVPADARGDADLHRLRLALGIPEALVDYAYGEVFPADVNMDELHGIDFKKGCFVGQEVVARMKHRGTARWRTLSARSTATLPPPGTPLVAGNKAVGALMSSVDGTGLALARIDRVAEARAEGLAIQAGGVTVTLSLPPYAVFDWPEVGGID